MLALFFAISLHYYASALDTKSESKIITVPLTVNSVPAGAIFDPQTAPNISVTVSGASDVIDRLSGTNVIATANLSSCKIGNNPQVHVEVHCADITNGNATLQDVSPSTIPIILSPTVQRSIPLEAFEPGAPPAGYAYKTPSIVPLVAQVVGDKRSVGSVSQLVVKTATSESSSTVKGEYPIVPLDSSGQEVTTVSVVPQQAHVDIGIIKVPAMKALIVSPTIVNSPPFPYRIASVQVKPESILVSGRPERLNQVSTLSTAAIDVAGASTDIQRQVQPVAPDGTSLSDRSPVTVTIHIVTEQPDESTMPVHATVPQTSH